MRNPFTRPRRRLEAMEDSIEVLEEKIRSLSGLLGYGWVEDTDWGNVGYKKISK